MIEQPETQQPAPSEQPLEPPPIVVRRRRCRRRDRPFWQFVRKYAFEIGWVIVVLFGIFLVFERMNIRVDMIRWAQAAATAVFRWITNLDDGVRAIVSRTTLSDELGLLLIFAALVAAVLRFRWWLLNSETLTVMRCPRCGGDIHQVHRHQTERLLGWFVPLRRYRCFEPQCRWGGLRVKAHRSSKSSRRMTTGELAALIVLLDLVVILIGVQFVAR